MDILQKLFNPRRFWLAVIPEWRGERINGKDVIELHYANKTQHDAIMPILVELSERGILHYWSDIDAQGLPYLVMEPIVRKGGENGTTVFTQK